MRAFRYLIILCALLVHVSVRGQHVLYPAISNLKGSVRSMLEVSFEAKDKDGKVQKGEEIKKLQYLFNTKKSLVEMDEYSPDGGLDERYATNYDENGKLIEETQYSSDSLQNRYTYRYDKKGNRIGWMSYITASDTSVARGSNMYDDKERVIRDSLFDAKGRLLECSSYSYNDEGHVTKEIHFYTHGDKTVDNYEYDMEGNKIQDIKSGFDGSTKSISKFKYNSNGNLTGIDVLADSSSDYSPVEKCKYDSKGNKIEDLRFVDGKVDSSETLKYDALGNNVEDAMYGVDGSIEVKMIYKYDSQGNKIERDVYKTDTTLFEKWTYKYDAEKNRTEESFYQTVNGQQGNTITIRTEYDKTGNWIKETGFQDGEPVSITEREIVYY